MEQSELTFVEQSVANLNVRLFRKESCCESLYDAGLWLIRMFGGTGMTGQKNQRVFHTHWGPDKCPEVKCGRELDPYFSPVKFQIPVWFTSTVEATNTDPYLPNIDHSSWHRKHFIAFLFGPNEMKKKINVPFPNVRGHWVMFSLFNWDLIAYLKKISS